MVRRCVWLKGRTRNESHKISAEAPGFRDSYHNCPWPFSALGSIPGFGDAADAGHGYAHAHRNDYLPGADPESVDELVTKVVEDSGSTLSGN